MASAAADLATAPPRSRTSVRRTANDDGATDGLCQTAPWVLTLGLALLAAVVAILTFLYLSKTFRQQRKNFDQNLQDEHFRLLFSAITTIGVLMWPIVWERVIGLDMLGKVPALWFAFLWPLVMSLNDIMYTRHRRMGKETRSSFGSGHKSSDGNVLIGIALAIGGLLASDGSSQLLKSSKTLLTYALMLLIVFVLPVPVADTPSASSIAIGASQRVAFNYASGLLIAGIAMNFTHIGPNEVKKGIDNICAPPPPVAAAATTTATRKANQSDAVADLQQRFGKQILARQGIIDSG